MVNPQFEMQRQMDRHNKAMEEIRRLETRLIEAGCTLRGDYLWQADLDEALEVERKKLREESEEAEAANAGNEIKRQEAAKKAQVQEALAFEQKREKARANLAASEKKIALKDARKAEIAAKNATPPSARKAKLEAEAETALAKAAADAEKEDA